MYLGLLKSISVNLIAQEQINMQNPNLAPACKSRFATKSLSVGSLASSNRKRDSTSALTLRSFRFFNVFDLNVCDVFGL